MVKSLIRYTIYNFKTWIYEGDITNNPKQPKFANFLKNAKNLNPKTVMESVLVTDTDFRHCWVPKKGTSCAQHKNPRPVLESVTKTDFKTGFRFKFLSIFKEICKKK